MRASCFWTAPKSGAVQVEMERATQSFKRIFDERCLRGCPRINHHLSLRKTRKNKFGCFVYFVVKDEDLFLDSVLGSAHRISA